MIGSGRVLGVDLGSQRIGVAVTDSDQTVATGATLVKRTGDRRADHRALAELVKEYDAVGMVVGLPLTLAGEVGPAARAVLDEVAEIGTAVGVEVDTVDERFTTVTAAGRLRAGGRRAREQRAVIDQTAAAVLLESWLDRRHADRPGAGTRS